jgi:hypothetical protein
MHVSTSLFGGTLVALRLPTFVAGCLIPFLTYFAALLLYGGPAALLSLSLASASSPLVEYSFNARGYSLGSVFFLFMVILLKPASRAVKGAFLGLSVCAALALYSVPTMLYGVSSIYAYLLWRNRRRQPVRVLLSSLLAGVITVCFYSPVLLTVGPGAITKNKWVVPISRSAWPAAFIAEFRSLASYWTTDIPLFAVAVFASALLWAVARRRTRIFPPVPLLIVLALILCFALPLQSIVPPRRSYLYALPLCCMAIGIVFASVMRTLHASQAVAVVLALVVVVGLGSRVLTFKSLEHSGLEAAGCRSAPQIVRSLRTGLEQGGQFICGEGFDSTLDFYILEDGIHYHPLPKGPLLVVLKKGTSPTQFVDQLALKDKVEDFTYLATFEDAVVYQAARGPNLRFSPGGDADIGAFTTYRE